MRADAPVTAIGPRAAAQIKRAVGRRVAPALGLVRFVESFDRPTWLYRLWREARSDQHRFRVARPVTAADVELSQRLIAAYRLAQSEAPPTTGMWSHSVFEERQRLLTDALDQRDAPLLSALLSSMFQADFVLGMASGSMLREDAPPLIRRLSWLAEMNKLVALGEALGTTRSENPEQGRVGSAVRAGIDAVVEGIEDQLELSLDFPQVGAAYGVVVGDRVITPESPDQIYAGMRLREVMADYLPPAADPPVILEIGGGYGAMAYWLLGMADARYVIVDLPVVNVLQGYFLAQAVGHDAVSLYGEPPARKITIVPCHALATVQTPVDVVANKDSLPEIPLDEALGYLEWARSNCRGVVYSNNQESAAEFGGTPQNVVCELMEDVGGFTRVRRDASWLRRGYVEEVYRPASGA